MALTQVRDVAGVHRDVQMSSPRKSRTTTGHPAVPLVNSHAALFAAATEGFRRAQMAARRSLVEPSPGRP
jgi:hypothetical protein